MSTTKPAVSAEEIGKFFSDLFGLSFTTKEDTSLTCDRFGVLASYVDGDGAVKGRILLDLQGAAILGAALTQVPMGAAEDAVDAGSLPDNLCENVEEVLNIAVNVFPAQGSQRLVLKTVTTDAADKPELTDAVALSLDVQRYGTCQMFVFCD